MLRNGKAFHRCFGRDKFDHFSIAKLILFRFCVFCSLFRLTLCDCSVSLPRRLSDQSAIPTGDVDSLQIVWQNGDSIWSQKIDRKFCKATGESLLVNRSQSLAFPGNGLAAAVATKAGLAVAWKDTGGLFLTLGEGWKLRVVNIGKLETGFGSGRIGMGSGTLSLATACYGLETGKPRKTMENHGKPLDPGVLGRSGSSKNAFFPLRVKSEEMTSSIVSSKYARVWSSALKRSEQTKMQTV